MAIRSIGGYQRYFTNHVNDLLEQKMAAWNRHTTTIFVNIQRSGLSLSLMERVSTDIHDDLLVHFLSLLCCLRGASFFFVFCWSLGQLRFRRLLLQVSSCFVQIKVATRWSSCCFSHFADIAERIGIELELETTFFSPNSPRGGHHHTFRKRVSGGLADGPKALELPLKLQKTFPDTLAGRKYDIKSWVRRGRRDPVEHVQSVDTRRHQ